ncbi:unnamed protein product [Rotaria sp. Silwood1]|nr:unnamed protein product [Rotaria sp. Silwood1]CAF4651813.1 unnamed protein product [Rotaria sp. Silwood1]
MATVNELNICSTCNKSAAKYFCIGCKKYFCLKDFKEHEQQLSIKFDNEVVRSHDELIDQIQKLEKSHYLSANLFNQIEEWKKVTIEKVEKAAEKAEHQLIELITKQKIQITKQLDTIAKEIRYHQQEENFLENDIDQLKLKINKIQKTFEQLIQKDKTKAIIIHNDQIDWNKIIYIRAEQLNCELLRSANVNANAKWIQNGITIAGGNGQGDAINQLSYPHGLCVDDDQNIYIADCSNHRIVEWKCGSTIGRIVAGGNGKGNRSDQLNSPTDVIIDKDKNSLIICDFGNKRVVRWSCQHGTNGETIISNVGCWGLTMDGDGSLYIVDQDKYEVRRYRIGENQGIIVAGGNGEGNRLDQLSCPTYIFVDRDHSLYVSDYNNHRVMKWMKGEKQGIIVASDQDQKINRTQLSHPMGIIMNQSGTLYVTDYVNYRIMRWSQGATQGNVIIGGNGRLSSSIGLSFDREGNLYVCENGNHRVQKFNIDQN